MKAPDKIYIRPSASEAKYGDIEYIRKDELLEWANNELNGRRDTGDDYFHSAIVVLNDLIEKLNSL